ncbi:MAG: hypothetical protein EAZ65_00765 [Verrucomicrobia bacterium]|nr:MAG: hypothetical protein EAZ84_05300 [Verrucomicrobiota bacterium]TAE89257.1 MAG: hypothetical protein EAZ82_01130 [Verrucomicrobiota bacterium]TAF27869.1 MAG: hypothetical protein EAZ71_00770 [Verrucomicrobiota bacterium]TAF42718.1 MAG: hypothetical protein EAZ65_00765 [Verrucomicrobiota bacterium]
MAALSAILYFFLAGIAAAGTHSALWGRGGESWDPAGRLPDFSHAGYHSGEKPIPRPPIRANVKDFGALGDGQSDDTAAFEKAIAAVNNGALLVPAGRYRITRVLSFRKSNFVLRGEGSAKSILLFPKTLVEVLGKRQGTGEYGNWSWTGGFLWVEGRESNSHLADLVENAPRGSRTLKLSTTRGLAVGQTIRLMMDDPDGSLGRHIHADLLDAHPSLVRRNLVRFPARIESIQGNRVTLSRPLRLDARTAWKARLHAVRPGIQEIGIEGLGLHFPKQSYAGHYHETGANAIWIDGAWNCWIRDIAVRNCDNGILLERSTFCTVDQIRLRADQARERKGGKGLHSGTHSGHHGLQQRGGDDCLFSRFNIDTRFHHDLTVENATGTVFMKGAGVDICFDHHTHLPYENLFTEIDIGAGTRPWLSNGSRDPESGARETFWNIRSRRPITSVLTRKGSWPQMNLIGAPTTLQPTRTPRGPWVEVIPSRELDPPNLYQAQLARRLAGNDP